MRKMLAGVLLLAILFIGVIINSFYLENKLSTLNDEIKKSYSLSATESEAVIKKGLYNWESLSRYVNIVLSNSDYDKISEAFYECLSDPMDLALRDKLIYKINSIMKSEKIRFGSIF